MNTINTRKTERGNVLFLILIAVALFAALSYVVTQSTRSGGGSTEREKNILSSASMTQYPTSLRTAITRMILAGTSLENLRFNSPATFSSVASTNMLVFHPAGGGALYQDGAPELSVNGNTSLVWTFNLEYQVPEIGTSDSNNSSNDLVAFLSGVSDGVCRQVNEQTGLKNLTGCTLDNGIPTSSISAANIDRNYTHSYTIPTSASPTLSMAGCADLFARRAQGCFKDASSRNVFFAVLLER